MRILKVVSGLLLLASAAQATCGGDCDGNGAVTVGELIRSVNVALGSAALDSCAASDLNGNGRIAINELLAGVNAALSGCSPDNSTPTPAPTPTATPGTSTCGERGRLVYSAFDFVSFESDLYLICDNGAARTRIPQPGYTETYPVWSPDGTRLVYRSSLVISSPDPSVTPQGGIVVENADGGGRQMIADEAEGRAPAWSPDGTRIAFIGGSAFAGTNTIEIVNADGTGRRTLVANQGGEQYGPLSWSPDGTRIVFESNRGKVTGDFTGFEIFVMGADGSGITPLTDNGVSDFKPDWHPDGTRIAFTRRDGVGTVWVMNADGSGAAPLIEEAEGAEAPAWNADGSAIAYLRSGRVVIADADGSNRVEVPNQLTDPGSVSDFDLR
ncbi:MAG: hypothetical protein ACRERC_05465 [Candidatus Binatia bacterium]